LTVSQEIKTLNEIEEDAAPFNNKVPAFDWGLNVIKNRGVTYFKGASLCFGFGLFVIYFMQNNFYPEFDLFGFGSLLVTSSVIGVFVTAYMAFGFAMPSIFWLGYFSDKGVREELGYALKTPEANKEFYNWRMKYCYFLPVTICLIAVIVTFSNTSEMYAYTLALVVVPVFLGIIFGIALAKKYRLPNGYAVQYVLTGSVSYIIATLVTAIFGLAAAKNLVSWDVVKNNNLAMVIAFLIGGLMVFITTISLQMRKGYVYMVSAIVGVIAMTLLNAWMTMPGAIVRNFGIGNYEAESVLVKDEMCKQLKSNKYLVDEGCALKNIHVVWAWGGSYSFRLTDGRQLKLDKESVGSIVAEKSVKKGRKNDILVEG